MYSNMPPLDVPLLDRPVVGVPPAPLLRHTLEEALEAAERLYERWARGGCVGNSHPCGLTVVDCCGWCSTTLSA
jgi:hypothetical protein